MTREECDSIMAPAINQALVSMGFCRNFPWALVFAPTKYHGLGIPHIYTSQEIERISTLINHSAKYTFTGLLLRVAMENSSWKLGWALRYGIYRIGS
jgi:hypothetical protein